MSDNPEQEDRRRVTAPAVMLAIILLLLYPVSIGPAAWLAQNGLINQNGPVMRGLEVFYAPLVWGIENVPGTWELYLKYLRLFGLPVV
jgi:uncharacterized RDD family membrane protein YckC